jgi:hypothetical protein
MIERLKKWYNRTWSDWVEEPQYRIRQDYVILRRTSNDGLVQFKRVDKF